MRLLLLMILMISFEREFLKRDRQIFL
jgi:hypothetical protein